MTWFARLRTAAVVAAGSLVLVGGSAPAARASDVCEGSQVVRCISVYWDRTSDTYQARASIKDAAGGDNYTVAVNQLRLQRWDSANARWVTIPAGSLSDYDGWFGTSDYATGNRVSPCQYRSYRAVAYFQWDGPSPGSRWISTGGYGHNCSGWAAPQATMQE